MTVEFENESTLELGIDLQGIAGQVIAFTLDYMECPYEAQVNVLVTGEEEIHEINLQQRGIDRATDVLSFPMAEYEVPGDFDFLESEEEMADCFDPDSGELLLGDIVICAQRVIAQAEEYGHSVKREYAFLLTHSMLHLMGFDHMEEQEAAVMEQKQREILDQLGITR
jgi:probable rRNA maturation factor